MIKKVPLRKCLATGEICPKKDMIRIVKNKEGNVFVDLSSKANGRGAYLQCSELAVQKARKSNCLGRALETEIPITVYEELEVLVRGK